MRARAAIGANAAPGTHSRSSGEHRRILDGIRTQSRRTASPFMSKPAVYIVDNNEGFCRSLEFALQTSGHRWRSFQLGEDFLDAAAGLEPGAVLVDLGMPGIGGLSLIVQIARSRLPFFTVAVTGHVDPVLRTQALSLGARAFLTKPFTLEELAAVIHGD